MRSAKAFSPAHITGFFTIQDTPDDPMQSGSLGAGFSIKNGTTTKVSRHRSMQTTLITVNGIPSPAPVSAKTVSLFFQAAGMQPQPLRIRHTVTAPQGAGFGTSGAGALSLALALNKLYNFPLTEDEAVAVAHCADVLCKTGLGTVVGERQGGFELRLKAGAKPHGIIDGFCPKQPLYTVFVCFGPLSTSDSLTDPQIRATINRFGNDHLLRLKENPEASRFLTEASHFSEEIDLFSPNGRQAATLFKKNGFQPAMLMFGDGIYTFCASRNEAQKLKKIVKKNLKSDILISKISEKGAQIL